MILSRRDFPLFLILLFACSYKSMLSEMKVVVSRPLKCSGALTDFLEAILFLDSTECKAKFPELIDFF